MKQNMLDDDYIKSILLGLNCCSIRLTYPNVLFWDFGKIIEYTLVNNIKKLTLAPLLMEK